MFERIVILREFLMAKIQAFRAYRYDLGRVGALQDVVAPPYDVIDPQLQQELYDRSPHNVIRLILNKEEPADNENSNRYTRAARFLRDWQREGILRQDSARCLYIYHQDFEIEGRPFTRKGFMTRVRLEPFGQGRIFPHELTLSGPKADRLKLFRATGMNLSPVFGLFPDAGDDVATVLDAAVRTSPPLEATDHLGVVHRLWPISDQHAVTQLTGHLGPKPIFIADGHHRYETGLQYQEERRAAHDPQALNPDGAANFILMMLVSMSDPGLIILPTHRLISGLPPITSGQLREILSNHFRLEMIGSGEQGCGQAWSRIEADGDQGLLGFGTVADGAWQVGRYTGGAEVMERLASDHSPAWRGLSVSLLHVLVMKKLLGEQFAELPELGYVHLLKEVNEALTSRKCQLAVLVPPATMAHVEQIAGNLEKMPPKSTYFYPKLLSGLVLNPLTGN
jgi:uncharacterized protein (DUF1015 family)